MLCQALLLAPLRAAGLAASLGFHKEQTLVLRGFGDYIQVCLSSRGAGACSLPSGLLLVQLDAVRSTMNVMRRLEFFFSNLKQLVKTLKQ